MPTTHLTDRSLVTVAGPEAEHFLQNILTTDLEALADGEAKPGALLSPQGKILFDFLISRPPDRSGFRLDCRAEVADDFIRRLTLYRLRAKVEIAKQDQSVVAVSWQTESAASGIGSTAPHEPGTVIDRRFPQGNVLRRYGSAVPAEDASVDAWHALRIENGVAESGSDFALGDAFPHDVLLDQMAGVGFRKGCYVGQEVVSRMQHRGTARRRVLIAEAMDGSPAPGAAVTTGGRALGNLGSVSGARALAIVRIDRVKEAMDSAASIEADGVALELRIPRWAKFTFPETAAADDA